MRSQLRRAPAGPEITSYVAFMMASSDPTSAGSAFQSELDGIGGGAGGPAGCCATPAEPTRHNDKLTVHRTRIETPLKVLLEPTRKSRPSPPVTPSPVT